MYPYVRLRKQKYALQIMTFDCDLEYFRVKYLGAQVNMPTSYQKRVIVLANKTMSQTRHKRWRDDMTNCQTDGRKDKDNYICIPNSRNIKNI